MGKRKPNAADRDLAEYVRNLPVGKHMIDVREDHKMPLKPEGGVLINHNGNYVTIIPNVGDGFKKVTLA